MRLQLSRPRASAALAVALAAGAVAVALLAAPPAAAQGVTAPSEAERAVEAGLRVYSDDDDMTVVTPWVSAVLPLTPRLALDVEATVDVVSGASVDVVTQASPAVIRERRWEGGLGIAWSPIGRAALGARVVGSHENDFDGLRLSLGGRDELDARALTLGLDYTLGLDTVGSAVEPTLERFRRTHELAASVTRLLDRSTAADLVVEGRRVEGFQASPYRAVPLVSPATSALVAVPEQVPERRHALAARVRLRRAFGRAVRCFVHAAYRFYVDDWGVRSHTVDGTLLVPLADERLRLGLALRGYTQGAADFWSAHPTLRDDGAPPDARSRDRTLGGMRSGLAALTGELTRLPGDVSLLASVGLARFEFLDFPAQSARSAAIGSLGVRRAL